MTNKLLVLALTLLGCNRDNLAPRRDPSPPPHQTAPSTTPRDASSALPSTADVALIGADAGAADGGARTFEGPGIRVVVRENQRVEVHTTDLWDASVDQEFESCEFARNAVPSLRRSMLTGVAWSETQLTARQRRMDRSLLVVADDVFDDATPR